MVELISLALIYITVSIVYYAFTFNIYEYYKYHYIIYGDNIRILHNDISFTIIAHRDIFSNSHSIIKLPIKNNIIINMLDDGRYISCRNVFYILIKEDINNYK